MIRLCGRYETSEYVVGSLCKHCVAALSAGVNRAHLVPPSPGALLQELYTLDGAGTLIAKASLLLLLYYCYCYYYYSS